MGGYLVTDVMAIVHYCYWPCVWEPQDTETVQNAGGLSKTGGVLGMRRGTRGRIVTWLYLRKDLDWVCQFQEPLFNNTIYVHSIPHLLSCKTFSHTLEQVCLAQLPFLSLMPQGKDFFPVLCGSMYIAHPLLLSLVFWCYTTLLLFIRGRDSFDKDNQDDEWNLIYATFVEGESSG